MHKNLRRAASALMGGLALATTALAAEPAQTVDAQDAHRHLNGPPAFVPTPWQDLTDSGDGHSFWTFRLTVDVTGQVVDAALKTGPESQLADATRTVKALRFRPFKRDGHDVPARFDFEIQGLAADYAGPPDRAFPTNVDLAKLRIALQRTACFGTCPQYRVEVRGDGEVTYRGDEFVLVTGEQHWRVPAATVAPLIALLRRSDYFKLDGYYQADITDNPTFTTSVDTGTQRKFIHDYAGRLLKDEPASGKRGRAMPESVTAIEDAIDAVSGVASWVQGDEHTMARLREAHWDFTSPAAGQSLAQLVDHCHVGLAREFVAAGAPVDVRAKDGWRGDLSLTLPFCGDLALVQLLESRGALARQESADHFLVGAAASGYPDFVAIALRHGAKATGVDRHGTPLLTLAAQVVRGDGATHADTPFDPPQVIALLVAAGANPNATDAKGNTPLHGAFNVDAARRLLAVGADANARNGGGETPLFTQSNEALVPVLVAAGADVGAVDAQGRTALEVTWSEPVALALLAAGAKPPADPARHDALMKHAAEMNWTRLRPMLQAP